MLSESNKSDFLPRFVVDIRLVFINSSNSMPIHILSSTMQPTVLPKLDTTKPQDEFDFNCNVYSLSRRE